MIKEQLSQLGKFPFAIADCLSSLGALVNLRADKLDALKIHKEGLMQQPFPDAKAV